MTDHDDHDDHDDQNFALDYAAAYARELDEFQAIIAARRLYLLASFSPSGQTLGSIAGLAAVEALVWSLQRRGQR